jgi:hypothetical protein
MCASEPRRKGWRGYTVQALPLTSSSCMRPAIARKPAVAETGIHHSHVPLELSMQLPQMNYGHVTYIGFVRGPL